VPLLILLLRHFRHKDVHPHLHLKGPKPPSPGGEVSPLRANPQPKSSRSHKPTLGVRPRGPSLKNPHKMKNALTPHCLPPRPFPFAIPPPCVPLALKDPFPSTQSAAPLSLEHLSSRTKKDALCDPRRSFLSKPDGGTALDRSDMSPLPRLRFPPPEVLLRKRPATPLKRGWLFFRPRHHSRLLLNP